MQPMGQPGVYYQHEQAPVQPGVYYQHEQPPVQYSYQPHDPRQFSQGVEHLVPMGYAGHAQPQQQVLYEAGPPMQYVTADGQLVSVGECYMEHMSTGPQAPQYMAASEAQFMQQQPLHSGQVHPPHAPQQEFIAYDYAPPQYEAGPALVYNISPQQYARLAQGGNLSEMEVAQLAGTAPPAFGGPFGAAPAPVHMGQEWMLAPLGQLPQYYR